MSNQDDTRTPKLCNTCGAEAGKTCAKCKNTASPVFYCSTECQRTDWHTHKKACGGGYVLAVKNRHLTPSPRSNNNPGPPPNLDGSLNFQAYFDNRFGEQFVMLWDFATMDHPLVIDGDYTWVKPLVFKGPSSFGATGFRSMPNDGTTIFAGSHLIGAEERQMLEALYEIAKEKYEIWLESGGTTSTTNETPPPIPYRNGTTKGRVITVPNRARASAGLPPCLDSPSRLPEGDTWEFNKDGTAILKSPVYGHLTLYFDSTQGQVLFEWDIANSETARIWASHLGWERPIEIGPEHILPSNASKSEIRHIIGSTREFLDSEGLDPSEARVINNAYYCCWGKARNDMLKGDKLYDDAVEKHMKEKSAEEAKDMA